MKVGSHCISCPAAMADLTSLGQRLVAVLVRGADILSAWHERSHQRRTLLALDDRMLKDIGISRAEARQEGRKPFWKE